MDFLCHGIPVPRVPSCARVQAEGLHWSLFLVRCLGGFHLKLSESERLAAKKWCTMTAMENLPRHR